MQDDIYAGLQLITGPTVEPLSVSDTNTFLRLPAPGIDVESDNHVASLITAIRSHIEVSVLRRALLTQTWTLSLRTWPGRNYINLQNSVPEGVGGYYRYNHIKLPHPPLQSVTLFQYITSAGVTKTVTCADPPVSTTTQGTVNVFTNFEPARLVLPFSGVWPTDVLMPGAPITIKYICGFATPSALRNWEGYGPLIQAMKLILADCWENRIPALEARDSAMINVASKWLMPYRVFE